MKMGKCIGWLLIVGILLTGCSLKNPFSQEEGMPEFTDSVSDNLESIDNIIMNNEQGSTETEEHQEDLQEEETSQEEIIEIGTLNSDNDFMEIVPVGTKCSVDLNGDGYKDTISYQTSEGDSQFVTFTINGGDYTYSLYQSEEGIYLATPDTDWYYITDLDTKDKYKEIAILDWGPSDDLVTYFIRFTGEGTYNLGHVPGFPFDESFRIRGDKTVESFVNLSIFQTWSAPAIYVSGSDQQITSNLTLKKQDFFEPYQTNDADRTVTLLKDIKLYKENKLGAETLDIKASDSAITFVKTDNSHWIYLERADGVKGWIYVDGYDTVVIGNNSYNARDLFDNLVYAG